VRDLLFDERETLRPLVNVYVNRVQVDGVEGSVEQDDEIRLVAAVAGG
jgi:molybdopterin converting factor small subunit